MTRAITLGAVGYLNTKPLVYGLERRADLFEVRFDVPSVCAALLHAGDVDLGLIPSIEYGRGDYRIVPDVAIASDGPVASVALFTPRPVRDIRTIALDTSSRTSAALLRVLCAERFGIAPAFTAHGPDLDAMLSAADAALLIGDPALWTDHAALGLSKIDLGAEWTAHTGLPFVWAFWAGREGAAHAEHVVALVEARDRGVAAIEEIAERHAGGDRSRARRIADYLRHNLRLALGDRERRAVERFYASARRLDIIDRIPDASFFEGAVRSGA